VFPYDKKSSLNSGAMLMAFSYGKTVMVTDIAMADDFNENMIYKYRYSSEIEHIEVLKTIMENIIASGKSKLEIQGRCLYEYVFEHCSRDIVKHELYSIVNQWALKKKSQSYNNIYNLCKKYEASTYRADIALKWISFQKNDIKLTEFLAFNHFNSVAVYGYGKIGELLVNRLANEGVMVQYAIDMNAAKISRIKAYSLDDDIPQVDVVIITACGVNSIKEALLEKGFKNIISLWEILGLINK
jgi:hypothetical protein